MKRVLAIDPGSDKSGWARLSYGLNSQGNEFRVSLVDSGHSDNDLLANHIQSNFGSGPHDYVSEDLVIEEAKCYQAGDTVAKTIMWTGAFMMAAQATHQGVTRPNVSAFSSSERKRLLGITAKGNAKKWTRQRVYEEFACNGGGSDPCKGTKGQPGPLYKVGVHEIDAISLGIAWIQNPEARRGLYEKKV